MNLKLIIFTVLCCLAYQAVSQTCSQSVLDLVLVIDSSGSIGEDYFEMARDALVQMVGNLNVGPRKVRIGIINYSGSVNFLFFNFFFCFKLSNLIHFLNQFKANAVAIKTLVASDQDKRELVRAVQGLTYYGQSTATGDALELAYNIFYSNPRQVTPRVTVLFTDGHSNTGADVFVESDRLKNAKVSIFSVGITDGINMAELNSISSYPPSKHVKLVKDYTQLYAAINEITTQACDIPIYTILNSKLSAETEKDELKKFQLDLVEYPPSNSYFVIEITNLDGFTSIEAPTFFTPTRSIVKAEWFHGPIQKLNKDGYPSIEYLVKVPADGEIMYFDTKSFEDLNKYDLIIKNI